MPQYFIDDELRPGASAEISGADFRHLVQVRRARVGDGIDVRDKCGTLYAGWIASIGEGSLSVEVASVRTGISTLPRVSLAVSLLKHGNLELVIQKSVEIGVARIIPLVTERTVVDIAGKEEGRISRWRKIAEEAAKQSMRSDVPEVMSAKRFGEFVDWSKHFQLKIITHPSAGSVGFKTALAETRTDEALIAVGPEGGFSPSEIELAVREGFRRVNFGETQLRAETAGIVLPAILMYELRGG